MNEENKDFNFYLEWENDEIPCFVSEDFTIKYRACDFKCHTCFEEFQVLVCEKNMISSMVSEANT